MKYLIYIVAIIILFGVNLGFFSNLPVQHQVPNLLLLLTIFFSLEKNSYDFFFVAFLSGLFLDFFSFVFFGSFTLAFLILALSLHFLANHFVVLEINWKSLSLLLALSLLILNVVMWLYGIIALKFNWAPYYINFKTIFSALPIAYIYDWLLLYPVYLCYSSLKGLVANLTLRRRGIVK
jgi:cell shape-determining protein MreD